MLNGNYIESSDFGYSYPNSSEWVLDGLDFQLRAGEKIFVSGKSGSGKTTLLYAMQGIVPGVLGGATRGGFESRVRAGLALQNPDTALIAPTVRDELTLTLRRTDKSRIDEKVISETLGALGIAHLADRPTTCLSTGEKQRVVIAAIMVGNPRAILLDEPTSHLDGKARSSFEEILESLVGPDRLVVLAANKPFHAVSPFDKIISLSNGSETSAYNMMDTMALPTPGERILSIRDVSLNGGSGDGAASRIEFDVHRGELIKIVGANGSGKSSLLKNVAGVWKPSGGKIDRTVKLSIGYLPQNPEQLLFCRTVAEEIGYGVGNGMNKPERISELAQSLNVAHLLDRSPHGLSLGQKQLVALASVLASRPDIMLLDEPTAHLDFAVARVAWKAIYAELNRGAAVLLADLETQEALPCHRRIALRDCKMDVEEAGK